MWPLPLEPEEPELWPLPLEPEEPELWPLPLDPEEPEESDEPEWPQFHPLLLPPLLLPPLWPPHLPPPWLECDQSPCHVPHRSLLPLERHVSSVPPLDLHDSIMSQIEP